jgi:3-carboxy-cis,cis-muconate cycloisomerase
MPASDHSGSQLFAPVFASASVASIFSDHSLIQAMLDFEAALARAEATLGIIPSESAEAIAEACDFSLYDLGEIGRAASLAGNPAIPLVKALTARVPEASRGFVHWGATSQDVIDTAFMLAARRALAVLRVDIRSAMRAAAELVETHRGTLMPGRTLMQQAVPITFGFKAAVWLSGLTAAAARLRNAELTAPALQFGGASGTLAALGENGTAVRHALAVALGLNEAPMTWHAERSRVFDLAAALANLSGTCSKIATDILLLSQTEVGEAFEPAAEGKGGSSTMPHKRNPVGTIAIRANHRRIAGLLATLAMSLEGEHERAAGGWAAEWETLRELFGLAAGSLERLRDTLSGLVVDPGRMRANLGATLGLAMAESLMMALATSIGREQAHRLVESASRRAVSDGCSLFEAASRDPAIVSLLRPDKIAQALDPDRYLGSAMTMIGATLDAAGAEMEIG